MKLVRLVLIFAILLLTVSFALAQDALTPDDEGWFTSQCQPLDESVVTPLNVMPAEPLRIAVLGLENNPFWIQ